MRSAVGGMRRASPIVGGRGLSVRSSALAVVIATLSVVLTGSAANVSDQSGIVSFDARHAHGGVRRSRDRGDPGGGIRCHGFL